MLQDGRIRLEHGKGRESAHRRRRDSTYAWSALVVRWRGGLFSYCDDLSARAVDSECKMLTFTDLLRLLHKT